MGGISAKAVIMAGGRGERFWPLSTPEKPKQFLDLTGEGTLVQQTVERIAQIIAYRDIYVVVGQEHINLARAQLPRIPARNFIVEPVGRDTAPCIGLAAVWLEKVDPDAVMLVVAADHYIPDAERFADRAETAIRHAALSGGLVCLGVRPDRPETGFGYIELGEVAAPGVHRVRRFVEKPDRVRAEEYLSTGNFLWNGCMFAWPVRSIRAEIARHLPELDAGLNELAALPGHAEMTAYLPELFPRLPKISIDYGVLERSGRVFVVPGDFAWDDLGSWTALARLRAPDADGNVVRGKVLTDDCANLVVQSSGRLVAALGVRDLIVVETADAVLISAVDRAQEVRRLAVRAGNLGAR